MCRNVVLIVIKVPFKAKMQKISSSKYLITVTWKYSILHEKNGGTVGEGGGETKAADTSQVTVFGGDDTYSSQESNGYGVITNNLV